MLRLPPEYARVLVELKERVRASQAKAATTVNRELVALYLHIGHRLAEQNAGEWGDRVVEKLARDLRAAFPSMRGFSRTNLFYMRQVHLAWADAEKSVQQLVGQLPWGHHLALIAKVPDPDARAWYVRSAVAHAWSRNVLVVQIETGLGHGGTLAAASLARNGDRTRRS